jgi:GH18 family chitinase
VGLILSCVVTSLNKYRDAFDLKELSKVVEFISVYTWDLQGSWNGKTGFGNAIKGEIKDALTLV